MIAYLHSMGLTTDSVITLVVLAVQFYHSQQASKLKSVIDTITISMRDLKIEIMEKFATKDDLNQVANFRQAAQILRSADRINGN